MKYITKKRIANVAAVLARAALNNTPLFRGKQEKADKNMYRRNLILIGLFVTALVSAPHITSRHNHLACASAAATNAFGCRDGAVVRCITSRGKPGEKECVGGRFGPCHPLEDDTPGEIGTVRPKYFILMVTYAPPGRQGGLGSSSVRYGSASSTGSTVTASNSFKQTYSVSASQGVGFLGTGGEVGLSFSYGQNSSNSHAIDIKKTVSTEINIPGPSADGINHDKDKIWLWLNPTVQLSLTPTSATWTLGNNTQADIQYAEVGWLKDPSKFNREAPGVLRRFQAYRITTQDYAEMLKADPFANGASSIDTKRFQLLPTTFPYEPPSAPDDPVPTFTFTQAYSGITTDSSSVQSEYTVGVSVQGSLSFIGLATSKFKEQNSWTWTNTDTRSTSNATSESASVTVGGPSYGYSGPTDIAVYYDVIYKTFLFAPVETTLSPS